MSREQEAEHGKATRRVRLPNRCGLRSLSARAWCISSSLPTCSKHQANLLFHPGPPTWEIAAPARLHAILPAREPATPGCLCLRRRPGDRPRPSPQHRPGSGGAHCRFIKEHRRDSGASPQCEMQPFWEERIFLVHKGLINEKPHVRHVAGGDLCSRRRGQACCSVGFTSQFSLGFQAECRATG